MAGSKDPAVFVLGESTPTQTKPVYDAQARRSNFMRQTKLWRFSMYANLAVSLDRADELLKDLLAEFNKSLNEKKVSDRAIQLTHEICERLRSVLDRTARRYWDLRIKPQLSNEDQKAASVYFPIAADRQVFDSIFGRWRWKTVRDQHQAVHDYLLRIQPFTDAANRWLSILNDLTVQGKHIDLVPQKKTEERRITVTSATGSVSWGSGVTFGSGVSIAGAPIDPRTQRIVPTPGVTEKIETWVSFEIEGHGVNAYGFCQDACRDVRRIAREISDQFELA
jgi:hypothetical protein